MAKKPEHVVPDARRQSRAVWSVALSLLALTMIGPVVFLAIYDGPAPDDTLMKPDWTSVGKGTDPSPLAKFIEALRMPTDPSSEPFWMLVPLTPEQEQFQADHSSAFAAVDALLDTDPSTWIWPDAGLPHDFKLFFGSPVQLHLLESFLEQRLLDHRKSDRLDLGIADCLKLIRLGCHLSRVKQSLQRMEQALELQAYAEKSLEKLLTHPGTSESQIQSCLETLLALEGPDREHLRFAIQVHHEWVTQFISDHANQDTFFKSNWPGDRPVLADEIKVNQCLTMWLSRAKPLFEGLAVDWNTGLSIANRQPPQPSATFARLTRIRLTLSRNRFGAEETEQFSERLCTQPNNVMDHAAVHDIIVQILALRLYELRQGRLPTHLEELTSSILPSLPTDLYSKLPYRWNRTTQTLYSIGADGTDSDGNINHVSPIPKSSEGFRFNRKDVGQYYWWGEEARKHPIER